MIKNPAPFIAAGARLPSGLLMVGPPGTGKTLLARVMAAEAGVPVRKKNMQVNCETVLYWLKRFAILYVGSLCRNGSKKKSRRWDGGILFKTFF